MPSVVFEDYFEVNFSLSFAPSSLIKVSLLDLNSPYLRLSENLLSLSDNNGKLKFEIGTFEPTKFRFKISFEFSDEKKNQYKIVTNTYNLLYSYIEPTEEDRIKPVSRGITSVNNHSFDFEFNFFITKQLPHINLKILNDYSGKLSLMQTYTEVQYEQETGRWFAKVTINLDFLSHFTNVYDFDLNLQFINSFGKLQNTTIHGLSVAYIDQPQEEIPFDMFKITKNQGENILEGLRDDVNPLLMNSFTLLRIPDEINIISDNAFADPNWFSNINKIIFNNHLRQIGTNAFSGCIHVNELDFNNITGTPVWLDNEIQIFNCEFDLGYIWINDIRELDDTYRDNFQKKLVDNCGLPENWQTFCRKRILPDDAFNISSDGTLQGFKEEWVDLLCDYQIIKLPPNVLHLSDTSFSVLRLIPYLNPFYVSQNKKNQMDLDKTHKYLTRRLILNSNCANTFDLAFAGISGLSLFSSQKITTIEPYAFINSDYYLPWEIDYHDVFNEKRSVYFYQCDNLTSIGESAFASCNFFGELTLPQNLQQLGNGAFANCGLSKIVFSNSYLNVENEAFAISQPGSQYAKKLEIIDLSSYVWDGSSKISWFENGKDVFKNCCADSGIIYFNKEVAYDLKKEAFEKLIANHGIPKEKWNWKNKI